MKKYLSIILTAGMLVGLSACYSSPRTAWSPRTYKKKNLKLKKDRQKKFGSKKLQYQNTH